MSATVHMLKSDKPDPLAELYSERGRLEQELQRFAVVDRRLGAAGEKLDAIGKSIAALDAADRAAMEKWAQDGVGDAPHPALAERRALIERQFDAEAERQAAQVGVDAVSGRRMVLIGEMNAIGARICEARVSAALDEARKIHTEVSEAAAGLATKMMRIEALRQALTESGASSARQNDVARGPVFQSALGAFDKLRAPEVLADPATVERFKREWLEALR
jgi:hypothetical protein